jgi:hypothetical protein
MPRRSVFADVSGTQAMHGRCCCEGNVQEAIMKLLAMTITMLSLAPVTPATANVNPTADAVKSIDTATMPGKPDDLMLAGRRRKCQENLGYGRTGSYGCG